MPIEQDHEDRLNALVERCLTRVDAEGEAAIELLCQEHPELAEGLRRRLGVLQEMGLLGIEAALEPLESVGGYELREVLGEGGMGIVYRAFDPGLSRDVALKLLRPELLLQPGARTRFVHEAEAAARLQHPGIVGIYGAGEHRPEGAGRSLPFLALELVEGRNLAEVLRGVETRPLADLHGSDLGESFEGGWTEAVIRVVRDVAIALQHAHERAVLHRDVKPSNLVIDETGRPRLLDFGVARALGQSRITRTGSAVGSLEYMAPEQLSSGSADLDARVDVFGLGATLYELLTLHSPFSAATPEEIMRRIREGVLIPPRKHAPLMTRDVEAVCCKALSVLPDQRYASAAEFAGDLDNLLRLRPVGAAHVTRIRRWWRQVRRHPEWLAAGLLASLGLAAVPLAIAMAESRAEQRVETAGRRAAESEARLTDMFASMFDLMDTTQMGPEQAHEAFSTLAQAGTHVLQTDGPALENVERLVQLAATSSSRGAWGSARQALEAALDSLELAEGLDEVAVGELKMETMLHLAGLAIHSGNQDRGQTWYERVIELDRNLPQRESSIADRAANIASLHYTRARLAWKGGSEELGRLEAERGLARIAEAPESPEGLRVKAHLLTHRGQIERGVGERLASLESTGHAVKIFEGLHGPETAPHVRADMVTSLRQLAQLRRELEGPAAALPVLERAIQHLELRPDQEGPRPQATFEEVYERAAVLHDLAESKALLGLEDEAVEAARRAERELAVARERFGESSHLRSSLAQMHSNVSSVWMGLGDSERATAMGQEALGMFDSLLSLEGTSQSMRRSWLERRLMVRYTVAAAAILAEDHALAEQQLRAIVEEAELDSPRPPVRETRTLACLELGVALAGRGRYEEALEAFELCEESLNALDELVQPGVQSARIWSGLALCRANAGIDSGRFELAGKAYEASVIRLRIARGRFPREASFAEEHRGQLESLVYIWTQAGQHERALDAAQRLEQLAADGDSEAGPLVEAVRSYLSAAGRD